jgi:hypothetical protein
MARSRYNPLHLAKAKRNKLFTLNRATKRMLLVLTFVIIQVSSGITLLQYYQDGLLYLYMVSTDLIIIALALPHFDNYIMSQRPYNRASALRRNGGTHTEQEWLRLKRRYNYCCANPVCRKEETEQEPLTKDHIIPVICGGTDIIANLQPLCRSCNSSKGTRIIDYR